MRNQGDKGARLAALENGMCSCNGHHRSGRTEARRCRHHTARASPTSCRCRGGHHLQGQSNLDSEQGHHTAGPIEPRSDAGHTLQGQSTAIRCRSHTCRPITESRAGHHAAGASSSKSCRSRWHNAPGRIDTRFRCRAPPTAGPVQLSRIQGTRSRPIELDQSRAPPRRASQHHADPGHHNAGPSNLIRCRGTTLQGQSNIDQICRHPHCRATDSTIMNEGNHAARCAHIMTQQGRDCRAESHRADAGGHHTAGQRIMRAGTSCRPSRT